MSRPTAFTIFPFCLKLGTWVFSNLFIYSNRHYYLYMFWLCCVKSESRCQLNLHRIKSSPSQKIDLFSNTIWMAHTLQKVHITHYLLDRPNRFEEVIGQNHLLQHTCEWWPQASKFAAWNSPSVCKGLADSLRQILWLVRFSDGFFSFQRYSTVSWQANSDPITCRSSKITIQWWKYFTLSHRERDNSDKSDSDRMIMIGWQW